MSARQKEIVSLLNSDRDISGKDIAQLLSVSYATIKRDINVLVKNRIIQRIGPSKGGYWKVIKNR